MKNSFVLLILLLLTFPHLGASQDCLINEPCIGVYRNYPPVSITMEKLKEALTINDFKNQTNDLNLAYKPSWVKEYISVEILTSYKGKVRKATSKNETLSQEQKDLINRADIGTDIEVNVRYMPDNNLKHNDPKLISFTFTIEPENEAEYPGGSQQLKQFLKDNLIDKISDASFRKYQLAVVTFTIDEEGHVTDPHLFWTSENEQTDKLLLETICNMPRWKPAAYANGTKVKQEFALTVGDMKSCVVPLLNIRQE